MPAKYDKEVEHLPVKEFLTKARDEQGQRRAIWAGIAGFVTSLVGFLAALSGVLAPNFSWHQLGTLLERFGWFVGLILVFQLLIMFMVLVVRKRNSRVIEFRQRIAEVYLNAFDNSDFNPHPQDRLLVE